MAIFNIGLLALLFIFHTLPAKAQLSSPQAVTGEYIVKFKNSTSVSGGLKLVGSMGSGVSVKAVFSGANMMHLKVSSASELSALNANPNVAFIEPNYILSVNPVDVSALGSPPDPSDDYNQSNANVQVKDSWGIQKPYNQGDKVIVAIIDTGLDRNHLLFKDSGSIWDNTVEKNGTPGVDDDGNGLVDDINGWNFVAGSSNVSDDNDHGTHVAGIVLGVGQDVFANPVRESKIKIMALKFLDANGSGSTAGAISAMDYAVRNGAKVINNSWGGPSYSQSLYEAYVAAYNAGVVVVSAAGNSATNNDTAPMYPANFNTSNNISVLATNDSDAKASFSNFGATTVNVGAPGLNILSSVPGTGCIAPGCYRLMSGTSMAAPFVTGLAALVAREAPQLSSYQIKSIIVGTIDVVAALSGKVITSGRVNAYTAIVSAKSNVATEAWPSYTSGVSRGPSSVAAAEPAKAAAGCGLVKKVIDNTIDKGPGGGPPNLFAIILMLLVPLFIAMNLRVKPFLQNLRFLFQT
ncbi:MAG: S8 family peptidase [Bdellovibrionota bacterium]